MHHHDPPAFVQYFFWAFPVWWCCVVFILSRFGWAGLARAYPASARPSDGPTFRCCSGQIGTVQHKNTLNVTFSRTGIYLVPIFLFRVGHSPLLLPWAGLQNVTESRFLGFRHLIVQFTDQERRTLTVRLPESAGADISALSGRRDLSPPALPRG